MTDREKTILRTSYAGIAINLALVAIKTSVGFFSHSVAIAMDAVNNFTDALSSIITIYGTKIANRPPDRKHPFGHGRMEYLTSGVIGLIILYVGLTAVWESLKKIIHPASVTYAPAGLVLIFLAVLVKAVFGHWVKKIGTRVNSSSLTASGQDALTDAWLSSATLLGALVNYFGELQIEGYLGLLIGVMIVRSGWVILSATVDDILGVRASHELSVQLKNLINSFTGVQGTYDLSLHNYGPVKTIATAHIQVDDKMTAAQIHRLTREISYSVYKKYGIMLTLGIYAVNACALPQKMKNDLTRIVQKFPDVMQLHGVYVDEKRRQLYFDLVVSFEQEHPGQIRDQIINQVNHLYPDYQCLVTLDADITD